MGSLRGRENREKRKRLAHIFAGFVILIHTWERHEAGHGSWGYFLVAGIVFIAVAICHPLIERKAPWVDGLFFVIEASLSFIIAYEFFHAGKKALPYTYLMLGVFQLVLAFVKSRKAIVHHKAKTSPDPQPQHESGTPTSL